jgi:hypothetical protein
MTLIVPVRGDNLTNILMDVFAELATPLELPGTRQRFGAIGGKADPSVFAA